MLKLILQITCIHILSNSYFILYTFHKYLYLIKVFDPTPDTYLHTYIYIYNVDLCDILIMYVILIVKIAIFMFFIEKVFIYKGFYLVYNLSHSLKLSLYLTIDLYHYCQ